MNKSSNVLNTLLLWGGGALILMLIMKLYKAMITDTSTGQDKSESMTEEQKKEQTTKMQSYSKKIDYSKLPKKSQTFYQGVADSLHEVFNKYTSFSSPMTKLRLAQDAMKLLGVDRSIKDSQSYYNLAELEAIYFNFGVRTVKLFGTDDLVGNLVYYFDYYGDNQIRVDAHNLFRLV